jgi:hypothetical protein
MGCPGDGHADGGEAGLLMIAKSLSCGL